MTARVLVAGIGNVFLGDDGFGVAVAQRMLERGAPAGVRVLDAGIRGFDLACALLEGWDAAILIDAVQRGGPPGTLYVLEREGVVKLLTVNKDKGVYDQQRVILEEAWASSILLHDDWLYVSGQGTVSSSSSSSGSQDMKVPACGTPRGTPKGVRSLTNEALDHALRSTSGRATGYRVRRVTAIGSRAPLRYNRRSTHRCYSPSLIGAAA